jgi:hypothetical protein
MVEEGEEGEVIMTTNREVAMEADVNSKVATTINREEDMAVAIIGSKVMETREETITNRAATTTAAISSKATATNKAAAAMVVVNSHTAAGT